MNKKILALFPILLFMGACAAQLIPSSPTATISPIATKISIKTTPQPTATGTQTATPAPTIDLTTTAIVANLISTVQPRRTTFSSPDGQWEVQLLIYDCTKIVQEEWFESAYDLLQVRHLPDGNVLKVADQLQYCGGVGGYGLSGIVWSENSRFFYFTTVREGVPDGTGGIGWHRPISRFETINLNIEMMSNGVISPDGQKIASEQPKQNDMLNSCTSKTFVVETLDGETLFRATIETDERICNQGWSSYIAWEATSEELVYLDTVCDQPMECQSNIYRVNLLTRRQESLLRGHKPGFLEVVWSEPDRLTLTDLSLNRWYYTISTRQIEKQAP